MKTWKSIVVCKIICRRNYEKEKLLLLKKMLNRIGPAIDPYGNPDIISSKVLLIIV